MREILGRIEETQALSSIGVRYGLDCLTCITRRIVVDEAAGALARIAFMVLEFDRLHRQAIPAERLPQAPAPDESPATLHR